MVIALQNTLGLVIDMHPRITELLDYVDAQTAVLRAAWDRVPADRRGVRPSPDRWSPAEIVHHLAIVERRVTHRLAQLIEQAKSLGAEPETGPILPSIPTNRVAVRDQRFRTSEASEPRDTDAERVWQDYEEARDVLKQVAASGAGLALRGVKAPHPVLGEFNGYEWIAFAGSHAARHAEQMREIAGDG
jgi:DinB superfamily